MADSIYIQASRYSQPALIVLGTIGAVMNQILFLSRRQLRSTSCSLYFRALSINDLFVLYIVVFSSWYTTQFGTDPSKRYDWYCKMKTYLNDCLYTLSPYFIVLACLDRLCTSSTSVRLRNIATIRIASYFIPAMVIFVFFAYCHIPIFYELGRFSTTSVCYIPNPIYIKIFSLFLLLFLCVIPPILMTIICSITLILLRQQRQRVMPINQTRLRQRDNQLLKMLFIYVASHIICTLPFAVTYVLYVFTPAADTQVILNLFRLSSLLLNANFATSFYVYTLGTPFYRYELYNLFRAGRNRLLRPSTHVISVE
jgi:hypothetical protein